MRINHNIPALNAHRQLNQTNRNLGGVLERLSSGNRINKAADDAAGMAISEKMKAQVRGLRKASQNTLDGISLIQTAEGAMNEVHSMLQRMRELAVQSANGTSTDDDRKAIQDEVNQLTSEINRIANGTEFNTRNLLRGNEAPNSNTTVHRMSTGSSATLNFDISASGNFDNITANTNFYLSIDGNRRKVDLTTVQAASGLANKQEALLVAVNDALEGVGEAFFTFSGNSVSKMEVKSNNVGGNTSITIEGSNTEIFESFNLSGANDFTGTPLSAFSGVDLQNALEGTGVRGTAEANTGNATGTITFTSVPEPGSFVTIGDERVDFYDSRQGPYGGSNKSINIADGTSTKSLSGIATDLAGMSFQGVSEVNLVSGSTGVSSNFQQARVEFTAKAEGFEGQRLYIEGTLAEFNTNLQVGPNQGQGFRLLVGNIAATALRISANSPNRNTGVEGASFLNTTGPVVTDGLSEDPQEYALDVSTEATATSAITVFDNAINHVAELRGQLGAIQNRLEYTAANLDNTTENLTAALSRIEDADMALEMSEYTKLNILNQAGTAMLAQANQMPQSVLQLLGG